MTENEAKIQILKFGDFLIKRKGIRYVAIVKDDKSDNNEDYMIEVGVDSIELQLSIHENEHSHPLFRNPILSEISDDFILTDDIKFFLQKKYYDHEISKEVRISKDLKLRETDVIKLQGINLNPGQGILNSKFDIEMGTIGAVVELENYENEFFLLSNWHVLMGENGRIDDEILDENKKKLGKLFWGIHNKYYDLALAKVTNEKVYEKIKEITHIDSPSQIKIDGNIKKFGNKTDLNSSNIYSKFAYVKIGYDSDKEPYYFKNQIITDFMSLKGDSGSLVLDEDSNKSIGVIFAGDSKRISIANYLYPLLNIQKIPSFTYVEGKYTVTMPSIKILRMYVDETIINF